MVRSRGRQNADQDAAQLTVADGRWIAVQIETGVTVETEEVVTGIIIETETVTEIETAIVIETAIETVCVTETTTETETATLTAVVDATPLQKVKTITVLVVETQSTPKTPVAPPEDKVTTAEKTGIIVQTDK